MLSPYIITLLAMLDTCRQCSRWSNDLDMSINQNTINKKLITGQYNVSHYTVYNQCRRVSAVLFVRWYRLSYSLYFAFCLIVFIMYFRIIVFAINFCSSCLICILLFNFISFCRANIFISTRQIRRVCPLFHIPYTLFGKRCDIGRPFHPAFSP